MRGGRPPPTRLDFGPRHRDARTGPIRVSPPSVTAVEASGAFMSASL